MYLKTIKESWFSINFYIKLINIRVSAFKIQVHICNDYRFGTSIDYFSRYLLFDAWTHSKASTVRSLAQHYNKSNVHKILTFNNTLATPARFHWLCSAPIGCSVTFYSLLPSSINGLSEKYIFQIVPVPNSRD